MTPRAPRAIVFYLRQSRRLLYGRYAIGGSAMRIDVQRSPVEPHTWRACTWLPDPGGNPKARHRLEHFPGTFDSPVSALRAYAQSRGYELATIESRLGVRSTILEPERADSTAPT